MFLFLSCLGAEGDGGLAHFVVLAAGKNHRVVEQQDPPRPHLKPWREAVERSRGEKPWRETRREAVGTNKEGTD